MIALGRIGVRRALGTLDLALDDEDPLVREAAAEASARADDETFWVKASGYSLGTITPSGFVQVRLDRALELLTSDATTDEQIKALLSPDQYDAFKEEESSMRGGRGGWMMGGGNRGNRDR